MEMREELNFLTISVSIISAEASKNSKKQQIESRKMWFAGLEMTFHSECCIRPEFRISLKKPLISSILTIRTNSSWLRILESLLCRGSKILGQEIWQSLRSISKNNSDSKERSFLPRPCISNMTTLYSLPIKIVSKRPKKNSFWASKNSLPRLWDFSQEKKSVEFYQSMTEIILECLLSRDECSFSSPMISDRWERPLEGWKRLSFRKEIRLPICSCIMMSRLSWSTLIKMENFFH